MRIFLPDIPQHDVSIKPEDDYRKAKKFRFVSVGDHYLFYRWMLLFTRYIPIKSIARCYIRGDTCSSACGCCRLTFELQSLMIFTHEGKQKRIDLDNESFFSQVDKRLFSYVIEELKMKNKEIAVGCVQGADAKVQKAGLAT